MAFCIDEELKKLPAKPGVYIMHDEQDTILYVGKAVNLRNRVRSYFRENIGRGPQIDKMVSLIARFEYIVTDSELEALILENNLIKEHLPKYNTLLKDDKTYPYIKVTVGEAYPRILFVREMKKDKARYFGPYTSAGAVKDTIELLNKLYKLRTCNRSLPKDIGEGRPCLNYHIGQCSAPCQNLVSREEYREQVEKAIKEHPNAVAVLVNNPTYYGICSDLRAIVKMAHDAGMLCLADEAHGTHFYFGGGLPVSAMAAGADMASVSMHKSGGSLTQSSLLLIGPNVHQGYVRQIINLTQTTSGSYLLMSSLDISRRNLALRGRQVFHQVADIAEYAREEINAVGGYYAFGKELCNGNSVFDFDTTKLSVHTLDIGLAGIEVYDILRDEYDIQIEFGDIGNILAYLSIGDRPQEVERLVSALAEIKRRYRTDGSGLLSQEYIDPVVAASPQEAFYAPKKSLPLRETEGMVCSEFVMCYPPGIPILAPGERITKEILNYIEYAKAKGCSMTGPEDPDILHLNVLA